FEILSPKPAATVTHSNAARHTYQVDERQLARWNLSSSRLPSESEIRFHQPDLWEQYRLQILIIVGVLLLQAAVITGLTIERRRPRAAESALRQSLLEVLHLNRTAAAGTLSASVAHELNQPLAAIQSYADAAMLYLRQHPPNLK